MPIIMFSSKIKHNCCFRFKMNRKPVANVKVLDELPVEGSNEMLLGYFYIL